MVRVLSLLSLFLFTSAQAAVTPSGVPSIGLGAIGSTVTPQSFLSLSNFDGSSRAVFTVNLSGANGTAGNVIPFRKNGVVWQVGSGVSAYCFNIIGASAAVAGSVWGLMYADASFADNATTGSLTTPIYQGAAGSYPMVQSVAAYAKEAFPNTFTFPAQKYPGVQIGASNSFNISMLCYEE